jgi:hypothetical protein
MGAGSKVRTRLRARICRRPYQEVEQDLAEGKDVIRMEKKKLNRIKKSKLKKKNAERALDTLEKGVEAIERRRHLLEEILEER